MSALQLRGVCTTESHKLKRLLHGLVKRGAISETQVLEEIAKSESIAQLPQAIHNRVYKLGDGIQERDVQLALDRDQEKETVALDCRRAAHNLTKLVRTTSFENWLSSLPSTHQSIIERHLLKAQRGLGDWSAIEGTETGLKLHKLRIHAACGFRVVCLRTGENQLTIITGYRKDQQESGIAAAIKATRAYKS